VPVLSFTTTLAFVSISTVTASTAQHEIVLAGAENPPVRKFRIERPSTEMQSPGKLVLRASLALFTVVEIGLGSENKLQSINDLRHSATQRARRLRRSECGRLSDDLTVDPRRGVNRSEYRLSTNGPWGHCVNIPICSN